MSITAARFADTTPITDRDAPAEGTYLWFFSPDLRIWLPGELHLLIANFSGVHWSIRSLIDVGWRHRIHTDAFSSLLHFDRSPPPRSPTIGLIQENGVTMATRIGLGVVGSEFRLMTVEGDAHRFPVEDGFDDLLMPVSPDQQFAPKPEYAAAVEEADLTPTYTDHRFRLPVGTESWADLRWRVVRLVSRTETEAVVTGWYIDGRRPFRLRLPRAAWGWLQPDDDRIEIGDLLDRNQGQQVWVYDVRRYPATPAEPQIEGYAFERSPTGLISNRLYCITRDPLELAIDLPASDGTPMAEPHEPVELLCTGVV